MKNISPKKIKWSLYHPRRSKNIDENFFVDSKFKNENCQIKESVLFDGFFEKIEKVKKRFSNGDSFEGVLINNVRHGKGIYRFKVRLCSKMVQQFVQQLGCAISAATRLCSNLCLKMHDS